MTEEEEVISKDEVFLKELVVIPMFPLISHKSKPILIEDFNDEKIRVFNEFAVKIFKELPICDKNHAICPINVFSSFGILYLGSNSDSYLELKRFLGLEDLRPQDQSIILRTLKSVLQVFVYEATKMLPNYDLYDNIHLLIDEKARYTKAFELSIKRYFNVVIDRLDFERDADLIAQQMLELSQSELNTKNIHGFNISVSKKTQIIILNTVRFKTKWDMQFPLDQITTDYFHSKPFNERQIIQMMSILHENWRYGFISEWDSQVVEIPLAGHTLSFILIVPKIDGINKLLNEFSFDSLSSAISGLQSCRCDIFLPKFKVECDYDFGQLYKHFKVFNLDNDLIEVGGKQPIKANNVLHKVIIEINSNGLKTPGPIPMMKANPEVVKADHPFVFVVKDNRTQAWVFLGKVLSLE